MIRRHFLRAVSAGSSLLGIGALLEGCGVQSASARPAAPWPVPSRRGAWDMSWVGRVNRPHRVVFDITKISDGDALWQASSWMEGYAQAEGAGDSDLNAVLVFRHAAVTMVLEDEMWARLNTKASTPEQKPTAATQRNPYLGEATTAAASGSATGQMTIRRLMARGAIVLACNNALNGEAFSLKQRENISESEAQSQIRASVAHGVYVMPNGIFSVARAQEAGCALFIPG
jgi:intracellular sulfur oxidation DsrE/DsrF family protein